MRRSDERLAGDPTLFGAAQLKDGLEVVVDGFALPFADGVLIMFGSSSSISLTHFLI